MRDLDGEGLGERLRIVKGHFDIQVSKVAAVKALDNAQRFAMRVAHCVEQGFIVKAGGFDYQSVVVPMSCGVAQVGWQVKFLGKRTAVGEYLAMQVVDFVQDHGLPR